MNLKRIFADWFCLTNEKNIPLLSVYFLLYYLYNHLRKSNPGSQKLNERDPVSSLPVTRLMKLRQECNQPKFETGMSLQNIKLNSILVHIKSKCKMFYQNYKFLLF